MFSSFHWNQDFVFARSSSETFVPKTLTLLKMYKCIFTVQSNLIYPDLDYPDVLVIPTS